LQEINNKFTISLGDLRTEIESAKWDSVRRAICKLFLSAEHRIPGDSDSAAIIVVVVLFGVGTSIYYAPPSNPPPALAAPAKATAPTAMREMSVGTDDELMGDEAVVSISDERLEKLLRDKGLGEIPVAKGQSKVRGKDEIMVDRI
jgi:hypothetical protein